jgi:hypothetical protein
MSQTRLMHLAFDVGAMPLISEWLGLSSGEALLHAAEH